MSTTITDGTTTVEPVLVTGWESERETRNVLHPIINRNDHEVTLRPAVPRSGTLELLFETLADAVEAEVMHAQAKEFTLTDSDHAALAMTYVAHGRIRLALDEDTRDAWTLSVGFQEVY